MRRIAPWLPIAIALATLTVGAFHAALQTEPAPWLARWLGVLPHMIVLFGPVPYLVPMLLLEWAKSVRRRSAAPPVVGLGALALASPALAVAALWPLVVGVALLVDWRPVYWALMDHRMACVVVWSASVAAAVLWVVSAASRWVWWPRPVAVQSGGPYR